MEKNRGNLYNIFNRIPREIYKGTARRVSKRISGVSDGFSDRIPGDFFEEAMKVFLMESLWNFLKES